MHHAFVFLKELRISLTLHGLYKLGNKQAFPKPILKLHVP
jgi:hypothetical protein